MTSYLVSFLVIAQFWMVHHRVLRGMRGHSEGLAWRNFGFLLALTLMPFTSDLIGRYGTNPLAITLFGLNLVAISLSTQWIFLYAAKHNLIKDQARSTRDERTARVRVIFVLSIVTLSIVLAWTAPTLAKFVWLLFLVVPVVAERVTRMLERSRWTARGRGQGEGETVEQGRQPLDPVTRSGRGAKRRSRQRARDFEHRKSASPHATWRGEPTSTRYRGVVSSVRLPGGVVHNLPADLRNELIAHPTALEAWKDITPLARNEFICWVEDAKQEKTRERRIRRTREELEDGMRRPCCWPGCAHRERTGRAS